MILLIDTLHALEDSLRDLVALLKDLIKVAAESSQDLRTCVLGRLIHRVVPWLQQSLCFVLQNTYIAQYSALVTGKCSTRIVDVKVCRKFQQDVIEKAKNVFLWVIQMIEELLDAWTETRNDTHTNDRLEPHIQICYGGLIELLKPSLIAQVIHQMAP